MNKARLLKIVNPVLAALVITQATTATLLLLGVKVIDPKVIFKIHKFNGISLIALIAAHLTLNWDWVRANLLKK